jgi:NAD(P)-dependent dehydrogenase (short-subunit alcohol dehydrogenase family)
MIDASKLLRPGLLEGVSLLLAGPPQSSRADQSLAGAVGSACAGLGARVSTWSADVAPLDVDLLLLDGAGLFAAGRPAGTGDDAQRDPRGALGWCLDVAWEATHAVVNGAFLPAERAGRIVYVAPAPGTGPHAEAARAALENLSRTLSIEWARYGITILTIAPGEDTSDDELAALIAYLASPAGAYFSGCLLDLRGLS